VFAICGKRPKGDSVLSARRWRTASSQTLAQVVCPLGSFRSARALSSSSAPAVDLNSTSPDGAGWTSYEDNTALINGVTSRAFVVCAA